MFAGVLLGSDRLLSETVTVITAMPSWLGAGVMVTVGFAVPWLPTTMFAGRNHRVIVGSNRISQAADRVAGTRPP